VSLLLPVGLALGGVGTPSAAASSNRCVQASELGRVEVGMTLTQAKRRLRHRAVWWGPAKDAYSQSFPIPCSGTRAMLIHASQGRVTMVVNERERPEPTCTTFAEFDQIRDGMSRRRVASVLGGKRIDRESSAVWLPVPCQGWSVMQITFRDGRVVDRLRSFYFG
jgi:hypothetical protein